MKKEITALTISNQKLIAVMVCLLLLIGACKKELLTSEEKIDPVLLKLNQGYVQNRKIKTINLNGFRDKVNMNALGTLKSSFTNTKVNNSRTISVSTEETYLGFALHTDSIKMITDDGHIRYVFAVKSPSPRAITFQNLTIDESAAGTIAFVVTYTPSRKWINDYKKGLLGKFDGERTVDFLDLKNGSPLPSPGKTAPSGKTVSSTQGPPTTSSMVLECTMVKFYYYTAYQCALGLHSPGDPSCRLTGDARAGYTEHTSLEEVCSWVNSNPPPSGGGSTTNPPPGYDPCDGTPPPGGISSKKKTGNQIMVIPPNICDSLDVPPKEIRLDPTIASNPKIKCLLEKLMGKNGNTANPEFMALLSAFVGKGFDVTFKIGTLQNNDANAETSADPNDPTKYNIMLNTNKINTETQMGWAKTLLHEAFHANLMQKSYELFGHSEIGLWLKKPEEMTLEELMDQMELKVQGKVALGILHHNFMAENINDIKNGLKAFSLTNNPNHNEYTDHHFGALAYQGLKETAYYLNKVIKNPDGSLKTVEINGHQFILENVNNNFYESLRNEIIPCN